MEYHEACEKLALMIIEDKAARMNYGWPIEHFHKLIKDGESHAMALSIVKADGGYGEFEGTYDGRFEMPHSSLSADEIKIIESAIVKRDKG